MELEQEKIDILSNDASTSSPNADDQVAASKTLEKVEDNDSVNNENKEGPKTPLTKGEKFKRWWKGLPSRCKDSFKHYTARDWFTFAFCIFLTLCYLGVMIYGIVQKHVAQVNPDAAIVVSAAQGQLIINSSIFGMLAAWLPYLLKWILRVKISFFLNLIIQIYCAAGMILGEAFQFYYLIPDWDTILHLFSGLFFTVLGYALFRLLTKGSNLKHKVLLGVIFGICVSLAVSVLWEVYEYACDSIGGLNMQKILPEDAEWFNGGDTHAYLDIDEYGEEILEFYSSPEGYKYALVDTMDDLVGCFIGTIITGIVIGIVCHFKPNCLDGLIKLLKRDKTDLTYTKNRYYEPLVSDLSDEKRDPTVSGQDAKKEDKDKEEPEALKS